MSSLLSIKPSTTIAIEQNIIKSEDRYSKLPSELQTLIFSYFTLEDLARTACVNKSWKALSNEQDIFKLWTCLFGDKAIGMDIYPLGESERKYEEAVLILNEKEFDGTLNSNTFEFRSRLFVDADGTIMGVGNEKETKLLQDTTKRLFYFDISLSKKKTNFRSGRLEGPSSVFVNSCVEFYIAPEMYTEEEEHNKKKWVYIGTVYDSSYRVKEFFPDKEQSDQLCQKLNFLYEGISEQAQLVIQRTADFNAKFLSASKSLGEKEGPMNYSTHFSCNKFGKIIHMKMPTTHHIDPPFSYSVTSFLNANLALLKTPLKELSNYHELEKELREHRVEVVANRKEWDKLTRQNVVIISTVIDESFMPIPEGAKLYEKQMIEEEEEGEEVDQEI